jgi:predicted membrane metal-binding protein
LCGYGACDELSGVAIAICFASGIAMGLWPMAANRASSRGFYFGELAAAFLLPGAPEEAAVLRAMLLGARSFLDRSESVSFQKTGVFHVLVVAGLHVGAFAAFLFWGSSQIQALPRVDIARGSLHAWWRMLAWSNNARRCCARR